MSERKPKEYSAEHPLTHVDALRHPLKMGDELVCLCCGHRGLHDEAHVKRVEEYEENSRWYSSEAASSWVRVPRYVLDLEATRASLTAKLADAEAREKRLREAVAAFIDAVDSAEANAQNDGSGMQVPFLDDFAMLKMMPSVRRELGAWAKRMRRALAATDPAAEGKAP